MSSQPPNHRTTELPSHPTTQLPLALGLILLAALAFVWPPFVPGWIIPQGGGDLVSFLWPTYRYATQHLNLSSLITDHRSLLWNPTLYSGAPFAADNQTGLFYPPNLFLFLLFPDLPYPALEALVAFHLFLAGTGMYLLMRFEMFEIGDWRLEIGLFPALAFMASDVFITHLGNYNIVAVSAWLPLIFLFLRQSLHAPRPTPHAPLLAGFAFGLAALAGHAQMTFILALACALYGLYELTLQRRWRVIALGLLSALIAFGVSAIALLPALEMLRHTARAALDYSEASRWSLPPLGLAGMISPLVFGRGARSFWPAWDRVELGYIGLTTLIVVLQLRKVRGWPFGIWLLGFGVLSLFIAFGKYTPIHFLLFKFVPGFASLRVPARFILLTNFALAILAGYALSTLSPSSALFRWGRVGAGVLAFGFVLLAPLPLGHPPAWVAATVALTIFVAAILLIHFRPAFLPLLLFAELVAFGAFVEVDRADPNAGYERGPAVEYLLAQPGPTRIDVAASKWQPDAPAVFGLESITGISNPLALAHYDRYYWSVGYRGSPQYNFLNAQFVVADKDSPPADSTFVPIFNEDPDVDIYLNTNAMPRVSLIYDPIFVDSSGAAFAAVHAPTFNPSSQAVLQIQPPNHPTTQPPNHPATAPRSDSEVGTTQPPPNSPSNLFYTDYRPGHFTVVAQTSSPAFLVFSEVWYPGWVATINGSPAPIVRANSAFMAVAVPAGESIVAFEFTAPALAVGGIITLITLLACAAAWLTFRRKT
ncbi:MAG: YfhO family protein [Chloroflexi bacterium]|nr:YfhO family protein [Chloroflexota bacterium]